MWVGFVLNIRRLALVLHIDGFTARIFIKAFDDP